MGEALLAPFTDFTTVAASVAENLWAHLWWLVPSALLCAGLWGAAYVWWRRRARLALAHRVAVDLLPSAAFDPSAEGIERHAARLARVPAAAGWLPRRATAVRMRHRSVDGKLATRLEGPGHAAGLLRLPSFPDVDVRETSRAGIEVRPVRFTNIPPMTGMTDDEEETRG
ncbi:hypothetical protein [Streptomyces sp. NPDC054975]